MRRGERARTGGRRIGAARPPSFPEDDPPPDLGPRYRPIRLLGRGGLGAVWLVRDVHRGEDVALKVLHEGPGPEEVDEVRREFGLLARIEHPGIARAHDFGSIGGRPFFTREFIPGSTPGPAGAEGPDRVLGIARDIAEALAFLHRHEVLHLDVKPGNIVVRDEGRRAVLIDFGLCRRGLAAPPGPRLKGSLPYMAPEYFDGAPLGPWTDVYAFGAAIYRLATGRLPRPGPPRRPGPSGGEGRSGWTPSPVPPSRIRPGFPEDLDRIIMKCLALDRASRFPSAAEVSAALRSLAPSAGGAPPLRASSLATIGRREDLERADRFLDGITGKTAAPPALLVVAAPGMGLTHFLRELKVRSQTRGIHAYLEPGFSGRSGPPGSALRCLSTHLGSGRPGTRWREFLARLAKPRRPVHVDTSESERRLRRASEVAVAAAAVREPVLVVLDDLHLRDEVSIALVIDLIRFLDAAPAGGRPPVGIAAGFREAGASLPLIRELAAEALDGRRGDLLTLLPLGLRESAELYRLRSADGPDLPAVPSPLPPLAIFARTAGCPRAIVDLAAGRAPDNGGPARGRPPPPLEEAGRRALLALALLDRPAGTAEVARAAALPLARTARLLGDLAVDGMVERTGDPGRAGGWTAATEARRAAAASPEEERRVHRRIAGHLAAGRPDGPRLVEAARHARLAGDARAVARLGIPAARWLRSTLQGRAALDLLAGVLDAVPRGRSLERLRIAHEMADLQAEVGDLDEGIRVLQEFLPALRDLPPAARLGTTLRLATLHARRGDFPRADGLFAGELAEARRPRSGIGREDLLFFLNEHAMVKAFKGDYREALDLCAEGLSLAGKGRGVRARELELNLQATRANVALRTFDYASAARDFGRALEIAEAVGSPANAAIVLSNLGIVHNQCDRYPEAIRAFREAERLSLRLDEGPSLVSIYGNLAVLHSKCGDFEASDGALREGDRLGPAGIGRRQEMFLEHTRGLALANRGRYAEARPHLEAAARIGVEMGDPHVTAFDEVYRSECLIFEARYGEASRELERLSGPGRPGRMRRMALARRALLAALVRDDGARGAAAEAHGAIAGERPIPFLDAWEGLFLAWSASIAGETGAALRLIEPSEAFFEDRRLAPGLALARLVRAEALFLGGEMDRAREALAGCRPSGDLAAALYPLLAARLVLSAGGPAGRAADLLAEAGAALVGNPLPEWSARVNALRGLCGVAGGRAAAERARRDLARDLPEEARRRFLRHPHWKAWTGGQGAPAPAEDDRGSVGDDRSGPATERIAGGAVPPTRSGVVARSRAMVKLLRTLDRLRGSDLPVLISGETGTGKEMVARIIHGESRRAGGPFIVVDPAAIPAALLEAELFGARAGAFTDLRQDRRGIISLAAGGTVLVDGVGDLPLDVQAKLLRAVSERSLRPLGAEREEPVDVRFLFATSRDLEEEAREGRFRRDLLHRIRVVPLEVPPLRERLEDIPGLVEAFLAEGTGEPPAVAPGAIERLRAHAWPGNARELRNVVARLRLEGPRRIDARAVGRALAETDTTTAAASPAFPRPLLDGGRLPELKERLERDYVVHHFRRLGGRTEALARFLGLGPRQLYRMCERLGISLRREKAILAARSGFEGT